MWSKCHYNRKSCLGSKDIMKYINEEKPAFKAKNLIEPSPGKGFEIYNINNNTKIGVLNLMGNVFMKKCDDVFEV